MCVSIFPKTVLVAAAQVVRKAAIERAGGGYTEKTRPAFCCFLFLLFQNKHHDL